MAVRLGWVAAFHCALVAAIAGVLVAGDVTEDRAVEVAGKPSVRVVSLLDSSFTSGREGWVAPARTSIHAVREHGVRALSVHGRRGIGQVRVLSRGLLPGRGATITATARARTTGRSLGTHLQVLDGAAVLADTHARIGRRWRTLQVSTQLTAATPVRIRIAGRAGGAGAGLLLDWVRVTRTLPPPSPPPRPTYDVAGAHCERLDYADPRQGVLDWSDEFTGTSVDPDRWRVRDQQSLSYDQARILAANVSVGGGLLSVDARRQEVAGRPFTTGYLDSIGHYSRQWGRWEIRAKLPTTVGASRGVWPAFWLRGDSSPGEIDVVEAWGEPTTRPSYRSGSYQWTVHQDTGSGPGTERRSGWGTPASAPPVADAFHVYAVDWSPSCVVFSFDHRVVGVVRTASTPWLRTALSGGFNMRLNLQIGQDYWGWADPARPDLTALPAAMLVDYVRVYRPTWAG